MQDHCCCLRTPNYSARIVLVGGCHCSRWMPGSMCRRSIRILRCHGWVIPWLWLVDEATMKLWARRSAMLWCHHGQTNEVFGFMGVMAGLMKPGQDAQPWHRKCQYHHPLRQPRYQQYDHHHCHTRNQGVVLALIASSLMLMPHWYKCSMELQVAWVSWNLDRCHHPLHPYTPVPTVNTIILLAISGRYWRWSYLLCWRPYVPWLFAQMHAGFELRGRLGRYSPQPRLADARWLI